MSDTHPGLTPPTLWILALSFALAGPLLAMAPLGIAPLIIATAILAVVAERIRRADWPRPPKSALTLSGLFLAWCALSLIWDLNARDGARKLLDMAVIFAATLALTGLTTRLTPLQRRHLSVSLIGGMALGLILLAIETSLDFPLYRAVMGNSDPKLTDLIESKRSVDALPLLVWPAALALARIRLGWLGILLAVIFTMASFKLTASSATMGMVASLAVLGLASFSVKITRWLLGVCAVLAFVVIIPFALAVYDAGGTTSHWLKRSAQHRVEIWHFAAEKILARPLFGYGLNASRYVPNDGAVSIFLGPDKPMIPLHPHDAFLQILLELGVVGAVIVAALLLAALNAVGKWPANTARFALAGFTAAIVVAGLAFGLWQTWWMATLAFGIVACAMIAPGPNHG